MAPLEPVKPNPISHEYNPPQHPRNQLHPLMAVAADPEKWGDWNPDDNYAFAENGRIWAKGRIAVSLKVLKKSDQLIHCHLVVEQKVDIFLTFVYASNQQ
ncbi:hypothetical protein CRG98_047225 [Punica granatum]|uniref:Uncharacterized protein n=1 Tax=Punica granatum TaxID=22663 RepID=A0A2I0HL00_PUNGR|nr:hypothetical protein CRG98_047225 [Punica granatum]